MDGKLKVSVALCTYNGADFVEAQLESVLRQSRRPDEVIISDDGSTDQTLSIVRRVAEKFPAVVRVVENPHRLGCVKNFESAIRQTSGDVIFLSDQDDVWFEHKIERMLALFAANDRVGLVYCDALLVDRQLQSRGRSVFESHRGLRLATRHTAREVLRGADLAVLGSMLAFRSDLKPRVLPIDESWGHDHWIIFIAHAVSKVRAVAEPLMVYRRHGRNSGGFASTLDGAPWKGWLIGARRNSIQASLADSRRWKAMLQRLKEIDEDPSFNAAGGSLAEFIEETERRLKFARCRETVKRRRRYQRIAPGLRMLLRGDYHFYVHGFRSFGKDVLLS